MFNGMSKEDVAKNFKDQVNTQTQNLLKEQESSLIEVLRRVCIAYTFYTPNYTIEESAKQIFQDITTPVLLYNDLFSIVQNMPKRYKDNCLGKDFTTYILSTIKEKLIEREMQVQHKYTQKSGVVMQDSSLPYLSGYIELYDKKPTLIQEFNEVTGYSEEFFCSSSTLNCALVGPTIEGNSFPETHVADIKGSNEQIVQHIESNIVAFSYGRGEAFGTGLLVHPSLVLTARHCVPGEDFSEIVVKTNYQKTQSGIMHFGNIITISKKVEENIKLDYAIIQLDFAVEGFRSITLELERTVQEQLLFFHHPLGGPKKVSSHKIDRSTREMLHAAGFYDTKKGSSGGVCVDGEGKIVALHSLGKDRTSDGQITDLYTSRTTDNWLKEIHSSSHILQGIYDENGHHKVISYDSLGNSASIYEYLPLIDEMISDKQSADITILENNVRKYESIINTPPPYYPQAKDFLKGNTVDGGYARHHIIAQGNMEFMWIMGQEYPSLIDALNSVSWQQNKIYELSDGGDGTLTINSVIWANWNLFIGPKSRSDDQENGYKIERNRPLSFPESLWKKLKEIDDKIKSCFDARCEISSITREDLTDGYEERKKKDKGLGK